MSNFQMPASPDVRELLHGIVREMTERLGIPRAEAIARINEQWHGQDLSSEDELVLHEDEYYWALFIYYGGDVPDWSASADRSAWNPRPKPALDSGYWTVVE